MNRVPLTTIAPEVFRKRLLVEGYFRRTVDEAAIGGYFDHLTSGLGLRTYGAPIIHRTSGQGRHINEGFDGFVPTAGSEPATHDAGKPDGYLRGSYRIATPTLLTCYQQPDAGTLLAVMSEPKKMRDAALASG